MERRIPALLTAFGFHGLDSDLYGYVFSDSLNLSDQSGTIAPAVAAALIGAGAGAIRGAVGAYAQDGDLRRIVTASAIGGAGGAVKGALGAGRLSVVLIAVVGNFIGQTLNGAWSACEGCNWSSVLGSGLGASLGFSLGANFSAAAAQAGVLSPSQAVFGKAMAWVGAGSVGLFGTAVGRTTGF